MRSETDLGAALDGARLDGPGASAACEVVA